MDLLAAVLLRRTGRVTVVGAGDRPADGSGWLAALEADLAGRGWLMRRELRAAAAHLPRHVRVRWADWLLATIDEIAGADRPLVPLYRSFPDTPADVEAVFVRRLLTHLFAVPGAPCVLCGRADVGAPLDPCGHPVCPDCFPPEQVSACPVCGRRPTAGNTYLSIVAPPATSRPRAPAEVRAEDLLPVRLAGLETDPHRAAAAERDLLAARPSALNEADRADLEVLVTATAPGRLDWLPETVPARETHALIIAWALHAAALTPGYTEVVAAAQRRWTTATDAARTVWAYSGGDPGLVLPGPPDTSPRPHGEPAVNVAVPRVRALPRPLRRAVLAHLDACGAGNAAEDMRRHATIWKRIGERLHPYEKVGSHPGAAVAFAALRGTRTTRSSALGAAVAAACARDPRRLVLAEHPDGTVSVRVRTHASLVEEAITDGDVSGAAALLAERPGDLWRRLDHLLRAAGDDPAARAAVEAALRETTARVAPGVLAVAAAALSGRDATVPATAAQLAALTRARATVADRHRAAVAGRRAAQSGRHQEPTPLGTNLGDVLRSFGERLTGFWPPAAQDHPATTTGTDSPPATAVGADGPPATTTETDRLPAATTETGGLPAAAAGAGELPPGGIDEGAVPSLLGGRPGPGMPRRIFFPRGGVVTAWTEPERRPAIASAAIGTVRALVDDELTGRAARLPRFDLAVLDAALAEVPAPMRERAGSAQLAGWPRGSVRDLPGAEVLRLFLHWEEPEKTRVDLDLSCAFFDADWQRVGHCDYTRLRFSGDAAVHSGDLTSAPAPLGATEYLDLDLRRLTAVGVHYAVPTVLSFNAIPFETLPAAFAGLMLPLAGGQQFDAARVAQRFDLQGDARMLLPLVVDLHTRRLLWTDLTLTGRGYGHSVGRHGDQIGSAAADQWEHFLGSHRPALLDVLAWHAAARADRILLAHPDGTWSAVPNDVAAIRAAAARGGGGDLSEPPDPAGRTILAGAVDADSLARLSPTPGSSAPGSPAPGSPAPGSAALTVTGRPQPPWQALAAADLLGQLTPD